LFGASDAAPATTTAAAPSTGSLFGSAVPAPTTTTTTPAATSSLFGAPAAAPTTSAFGAAAVPAPATSLFGGAAATPSASTVPAGTTTTTTTPGTTTATAGASTTLSSTLTSQADEAAAGLELNGLTVEQIITKWHATLQEHVDEFSEATERVRQRDVLLLENQKRITTLAKEAQLLKGAHTELRSHLETVSELQYDLHTSLEQLESELDDLEREHNNGRDSAVLIFI
jgi:nuclear pore complex protein Nup62